MYAQSKQGKPDTMSKKTKGPKQVSQYQTKPPISEGGEKPKSLNRIANINKATYV